MPSERDIYLSHVALCAQISARLKNYAQRSDRAAVISGLATRLNWQPDTAKVRLSQMINCFSAHNTSPVSGYDSTARRRTEHQKSVAIYLERAAATFDLLGIPEDDNAILLLKRINPAFTYQRRQK